VEIRPKPDGPGSTYAPTQAGRELSEVMLALQRWGSQWAEICEKHPGGDEDLVVVVSDPVAFARWDLGELEWSDAVRGGAIEVRGSRALARALPSWERAVLSPVTNPSPLDHLLDNAAERGSPS
jgi:hypothetical protein